MKRLANSFGIAFSMYSRIPMVRCDWTEENMKYVMCFFPWIGAVIGALGLLFAPWILTLLNTPDVSFDMAVSYLRICAGGILDFP